MTELTVKEYDRRLVYLSVYWWLQYGGRPKSELLCIHSKPMNVHCSICALKTS